jgi:hypothetical protein
MHQGEASCLTRISRDDCAMNHIGETSALRSRFMRLGVLHACASLVVALLALIASRLTVSFAFARAVAESWSIALLLACAWACPPVRPRALLWALPPACLIGGALALDISSSSPSLLLAVTWSLLTIGCLVGGYIGGLLEYPGMLMVVAYVAALGDCFSVFHAGGLTASVLANPRALALLTLSFPVLGTERVAPLVGVGDVAFVCLFAVGARRLGLDSRRTLVALLLALCCVVVAVEAGGYALPAVPFMGAAVVAAHPEVRRLPRREVPRILVNLVAITCLLGGLWLRADGGGAEPPPALSEAPERGR